MSEYVCPGCQANDMADECWHEAKTWELARALAVGLPGGPATWGTDVDRAWAFIDDAEALTPDVGAAPYVVTMLYPEKFAGYSTVGMVNGRHLFVTPDEGEARYIGDFGGRLQIASRDVSTVLSSYLDRLPSHIEYVPVTDLRRLLEPTVQDHENRSQ